MINLSTVRRVVQSRMFVAVVSSALGAAGGVAVARFELRKLYEAKYAEIADREIAEAKLFYRMEQKQGEFADPISFAKQNGVKVEAGTDETEVVPEESFVRENAKILEQQKYVPYDKISTADSTPMQVEEVAASIRQNIFDTAGADIPNPNEIDLADAQQKRENRKPYIVTEDEFMDNDQDLDQITLHYYAGDDVLTSADDQVIPSIEGILGTDNLRFGVGTNGDENVVYIRNLVVGGDGVYYEVNLHTGKYVEEVLGGLELRHSDTRPGVRRFRKDREDFD